METSTNHCAQVLQGCRAVLELASPSPSRVLPPDAGTLVPLVYARVRLIAGRLANLEVWLTLL